MFREFNTLELTFCVEFLIILLRETLKPHDYHDYFNDYHNYDHECCDDYHDYQRMIIMITVMITMMMTMNAVMITRLYLVSPPG